MSDQRVTSPNHTSSASADEVAGEASTGAAQAGDAQSEEGVTAAATQARITELEDRWRRAVADLDNFRKRVLREAGEQQLAERERVAAEWLPVLDNLELALKHAESDPGAIVDGIRAVVEQALAVLNRLGFARRDDIGEAFDPALHEAVGTVEDENVPAGTVVNVVRPGYGPDKRVLRPASVVVAKKAE
jgi:molecular chaperone GrpE